MSEQIAYNMDCMEYMKTLPDKAFDLAVVDPPYGGGARAAIGGRFERYNIQSVRGEVLQVQNEKKNDKVAEWDVAPDKKYFEELFRVSKNQIIWGGNYFELPPTRCFLVWRKTNIPVQGFSMASVEYAWTSFFANAKIFNWSSSGSANENRFHPTQKPVQLYEWIFRNYAKDGDKILDTHLGSGSSRIAARNFSLEFAGCELDADYFAMQEKRWHDFCAQGTLF